MLDLTEDAEEGSRAAKRPAEEELIAVKDEEVEPVIPDWGPEQPEEDDYKPDLDDVKPELRVDCELVAQAGEWTAPNSDLISPQTRATPSSTSHSLSCELNRLAWIRFAQRAD